MNRRTSLLRWQALVTIPLVLVMAACATKPAPNFRGRWKEVNRFDEAPTELPLNQAYVYQASPMDRTLKTMLTRWARDSRLTLSYLHGSDFTLYGPVADVHTPSLLQAVSQLNTAYAAQRVVISADRQQITVRMAQSAPMTAPAATTTP